MFEGVLVAYLLYGKKKALELADRLFIKWINAGADNDAQKLKEEICYDPKMKIPWFCGALYPNGVVTKEESNELSKKYSDMLMRHLASQHKA
jgi:hypothetical protein